LPEFRTTVKNRVKQHMLLIALFQNICICFAISPSSCASSLPFLRATYLHTFHHLHIFLMSQLLHTTSTYQPPRGGMHRESLGKGRRGRREGGKERDIVPIFMLYALCASANTRVSVGFAACHCGYVEANASGGACMRCCAHAIHMCVCIHVYVDAYIPSHLDTRKQGAQHQDRLRASKKEPSLDSNTPAHTSQHTHTGSGRVDA